MNKSRLCFSNCLLGILVMSWLVAPTAPETNTFGAVSEFKGLPLSPARVTNLLGGAPLQSLPPSLSQFARLVVVYPSAGGVEQTGAKKAEDRTLGRPRKETTRGEMLARGWREMSSISVYYEHEPGQPSTASGIPFRNDVATLALPRSLWGKFKFGTKFELWANGRTSQGKFTDHCPHQTAFDVSPKMMMELVGSKDRKVYGTRLCQRTGYRVYWRIIKE